MYLAIEDEAIGVVKRGQIVRAYPRTATVKSIATQTATPIESDIVDTRVSADALVQLVKQRGNYQLSWTTLDTKTTMSPEQTFEDFSPVA